MRHLDADFPLAASRRNFLQAISLAATTAVLTETLAAPRVAALTANPADSSADAERMRNLAAFTALTMDTPNPVPFGAEIVDSKSGKRLMRATNAVGPEHDPSAHAEVYTIRLACKGLNSYSLRGYTLYTTCEPCPMCMSCAVGSAGSRSLWSDDHGCSPLRTSNSDSCGRGREAHRYDLHRRWSGGTRCLLRALRRSPDAGDVQEMEIRKALSCVEAFRERTRSRTLSSCSSQEIF